MPLQVRDRLGVWCANFLPPGQTLIREVPCFRIRGLESRGGTQSCQPGPHETLSQKNLSHGGNFNNTMNCGAEAAEEMVPQ